MKGFAQSDFRELRHTVSAAEDASVLSDTPGHGSSPKDGVQKASEFRLTVLGTRGSMAVSGDRYRIYGGATSCYLVEAGGESIFLDAGSGMVNAPTDFKKPPVILLSHVHLDHMIGLGMYRRLSLKGRQTKLYLSATDDGEAQHILDSLYSPPFWPLSLTEYAGSLQIRALTFPLRIGEVLVEGMAGNHPGGSLVFRLTFAGKSLVYITDYEQDEESFPRLADFAREADLLLYDAQYTEGEYENKRGYGHSNAKMGLRMMEESGAGRMLLIHHDVRRTDRELSDMDRKLGRENVHFAKQGDCISLI